MAARGEVPFGSNILAKANINNNITQRASDEMELLPPFRMRRRVGKVDSKPASSMCNLSIKKTII